MTHHKKKVKLGPLTVDGVCRFFWRALKPCQVTDPLPACKRAHTQTTRHAMLLLLSELFEDFLLLLLGFVLLRF
jgi:hypothetical protein